MYGTTKACDLKYDWNMVALGATLPDTHPIFDDKPVSVRPNMSVFLEWSNCRTNLALIRSWLAEPQNNKRGYRLLGRFDYKSSPYQTTRVLRGLVFEFNDLSDVAAFNMRW